MSNFGIKNIWKDTNTGTQVDTSNFVTLNGNQTITGTKTFSALPQSSATPSNNNDLVTKTYADSTKNGNNWTTINNIGNISTLSENWSSVTNYATMQNSFRVEDGGTYQVLFKCNISSTDVYTSCVLACNSANYDNWAVTPPLFWEGGGLNSIQYAIYLKNNQFKLNVRRPFGTNTNWSTGTRIYVRKIAQGNIQ